MLLSSKTPPMWKQFHHGSTARPATKQRMRWARERQGARTDIVETIPPSDSFGKALNNSPFSNKEIIPVSNGGQARDKAADVVVVLFIACEVFARSRTATGRQTR